MSFLNPWFFTGLLAASVPVLLHLIKRERARRIDFPSLLFLRRVSKRTIRYQKLRHLLLLLLRTAALVLLALAFTRPFRPAAGAAAAPGRQARLDVVLLDNSLSMAYRDRWDRARAAAEGIVRRMQPGDRVALVEFSDRTLARSLPSEDAPALLGELAAGVALTDRPTRYGQALKAAERIALESGADRRVIHLISDFQRSGLGAEESAFRLGPGVELESVDVGSDAYGNLAFGNVEAREADDRGAGGLRIKASVVSFGTEDRNSVGVALAVDGRRLQEKRLDVPKETVQGVEFELPGLSGGAHALTLEVEDAGLERDNQYRMIVESRGKIPVFSIEPAASGPQGPASYFLANALNVSLSPYRLITVPPDGSGLASGPGIVVWNNAPAGALHAGVRERVRAGGGAILVLGDRVRPADFNRTFGTWLPVEIDPAGGVPGRGASDYVLMTDVHLDHPVFRPFSEPHSGTFSTARFRGHQRLRARGGAEVVARFDNGDPALVAAPVERGRVLVWASSADDSWNDLPVKAVFAPFWQELLRFVDGTREGRRSLEVGETLEPLRVVEEAALRQGRSFEPNLAVAVVGPDRQRIPLAAAGAPLTLDRAGLYEVRTSAAVATVAVNTPPRESDLAHARADELVAGWAARAGPAAGAPPPGATASAEDQERRRGFWRLLLGAVLVFFVAEGILADRLVLRPE